jgi:hypothetical protein
MAEYLANQVQEVALNQPAIFTASIPCSKGYVYHEDETGIFILRGITNNCFARYQVTFNGNIALPEGGTPGPLAIALAVNGESRQTSRAIVTPAAAEQYFNVTSTALITVPRGCCFTLSLRSIPASEDATVTPAPVIELQNANLVINRVA